MKKIGQKSILIVCLIYVQVLTGCVLQAVEGVTPFNDSEIQDLDAKMSFSLVDFGEKPQLQVHFTFISPREKVYLRLPSVFLREDRLFDRIEDLQVLSGGSFKDYYNQNGENLESVKILTSEPHKPVTIRYFIRSNNKLESREDPEAFQSAVIEPDYIRFVGAMALVWLDGLRSGKDFSLKIEWNLPEDFSVFNSYGKGQKYQEISANFNKIRDSLFVAGKNLRVVERSIKGNGVFTVLQGEWDNINDTKLVDTLIKLIETQRKTWRDDNFPYFLVSLHSVPGVCRNKVKFAGTAHHNSFRAYIPQGCEMRSEIVHLFSHELMHMWIGKKIMHGEREGHIDGKWFTEGFTDYYGRIIAYRAGLLSENQLFDTLNDDLIKYYKSKYRRITLNELVKKMYKKDFTSQSLEKIPYQQGEIIAWRLNRLIKEHSSFTHSLDDVIRTMLQQANDLGGVKNFTLNEMAIIFNDFYPNSLQLEFEKIKDGNSIAPPQLDGCADKHENTVFRIATGRGYRVVDFPEVGYLYSKPRTSQCQKWLD